MLALLLAAAATAAHPAPRPVPQSRSVDQRIALLEARQLLESQALWGIQASMPADALKTLADIDLHVLRDQEQEERVKLLSAQVQLLEQRLAAMEVMLHDRSPAGEGALMRVAPPAPMAQQGTTAGGPVPVVSAPLVLHGKQSPAHGKAARGKPPTAKTKGPRVAER